MLQDNSDFPRFRETFLGIGALAASLAAGSPWKITDTSSAGTPTYAPVSPSPTGAVKLTLAATSEVENVCLDHGNILAFGVDNLKSYESIVQISGCTSGTTIVFGMQSARADDTDATAIHAQFKLVGSTAVVCETDDGTTDTDDIPTLESLSTTDRKFKIDFSDLSDVQFFIDGVRVCATQTFSLAAATGSLQPFFQLQKTANTNVDSITIDDVDISLKRAA